MSIESLQGCKRPQIIGLRVFDSDSVLNFMCRASRERLEVRLYFQGEVTTEVQEWM